MVVRRIPSDELYHHGEEGQKWGVRHGPPYPLDPSPAKQAARKKKSLLTVLKDRHKGKQLRKAKKEKEHERDENRKVIESGDAKQILKRKNKLTEEELRESLTRLELTEQIKSYNSEKIQRNIKTGRSFIEATAATLQTIATAADSAYKVRNALEKMGIVKEVKKPESIHEQWEKKAKLSENKKKYFMNMETINRLTTKHDVPEWEMKKDKGNKS